MEIVNGIHNLEDNHDKYIHFASDFAVFQQSPIKRLEVSKNSDKHHISECISLCETIFWIVVIFLIKCTKIPIAQCTLNFIYTSAVRVWDARNPNADVLGQSQSIPPSPSPSNFHR